MEEIRPVKKDDLGNVMLIIKDAVTMLGKTSSQWQSGYPDKNTMEDDINKNQLYGFYLDDTLLGVVALVEGLNDSYEEIYGGKWKNAASSSDLVIHRIAVKEGYHHLHIGESLLNFALNEAKKRKIKSVKADTHRKNLIMQHLLTKTGFDYCGVIYLKKDEEDNARVAYEIEIK